MMSFFDNLTDEVSTKSFFNNLLKSEFYENKFFSEKNAYLFMSFLLFVSKSSNRFFNHEINIFFETKEKSSFDNLREEFSFDNLIRLRRSLFNNLRRGSFFDNLRELSLFNNLIVESFMRSSLDNLTSIENFSKNVTFLKNHKKPRDFQNDRRDSAFEIF